MAGSGGFGLDQFAGAVSGNYNARAAARLGNGDVVVVADVDFGGGRQAGIVKYDAQGQRVAWTGVSGTHSHYGGQYILFPNTNAWGATREVVAVHDVNVRGTNIYVLITYLENNLYWPAILRWSQTGQFHGWWFFAPNDGGTRRDAVAMDIRGSHMVVLGRRSIDINSTEGGYWVARLAISGDGGLGVESIATFNAGNRVLPADIAFERPSLIPPTGAPAYYVAYTVRSINSAATWPCIHKVSPNNSTATSFGSNGFRCNPWGANDSNLYRDGAVALHTRTQNLAGFPVQQKEILYLSTIVDKPASSIGLMRLVDGEPDTFWGVNGIRNYGGCMGTTGEGCSTHPNLGNTAHIPLAGALHADSTGVYVAGRTFTPILFGNPQLPPQRRPIFMHVDDASGALRSLQQYVPGSNARFTALVPGDLVGGQREFVVAGLTHYQNTYALDDGPTQIIATRLLPRLDLFSDGFEN